MTQRPRTRETRQRKLVYETLKGTKSHPTADWVFERVRSAMPKISLGTVYRNLGVLKNEGTVRELHGTDRRSRYDADTTPHAHFICTGCNEIRDITGVPDLDWRTMKELVGCQVNEQQIQFLGLCPACQRRQNAAREPEA